MNKVVACAVLGLGLTQSLIACSDDGDSVDATAGTGGGGASSAGQASGGSEPSGGKATAGTGGKTGGTGGKAPSGGSAGSASAGEDSGGEPSVGGSDGVGGSDDGLGGESAAGSGAGGEGGAPPIVEPETANPYWLSKYCDAKAAETLACEFSPLWLDCYNRYYGFLSDGGDGSGVCTNEVDMENLPLLTAVYLAMENLAAACPDTTEEDWRCDLAGYPEPRDKACRDAETAREAAAMDCGGI